MKTIIKLLKDFPWFILGGMGQIGAIFLFIAIWQYGHDLYGELALANPMQVFLTVINLFKNDEFINNFILTLNRSFAGFFYSLILGTFLGLVTGKSITTSIMSRPFITIITGIPPIAWIVIAMLWYGLGGQTVVFTIIISSFPIIFIGALQASRSIEGDLYEMIQGLNLNFVQKCKHFYVPHLFSYLFPSWVSALGMTWKIVIMAELLSANDGIGALLAIARARLETTEAFALIILMVTLLLIIEYIILEPIRREVEAWRN